MQERTYSYEEFSKSVGELMPEFDRMVNKVCKDKHMIGDVLQNSFVKIIADLKSGNVWTMHGGVPWPRFYKIIGNEAINIHRMNRRRRESEFRPEEFELPIAPTNIEWTTDDVMSAFRKLCTMCQTLLLLRHCDDVSASKILLAIPLSDSPLSPLRDASVRTIQRRIEECEETLVRILERDE